MMSAMGEKYLRFNCEGLVREKKAEGNEEFER